MSLEDDIKAAASKNFMRLGSNREIRRLSEHLHEGEKVLAIVTGSPKETVTSTYSRGQRQEKTSSAKKGRGIVVATNNRILLIKDGWIFRASQDYPYETISSVEFETGVFFGKLSIFGKGDGTVYSYVGRTVGADFAKTVRQLVMNHKNGNPGKVNAGSVPSLTGLTDDEVRSRLESLEESFKFGYISELQYNQNRTAILAHLQR